MTNFDTLTLGQMETFESIAGVPFTSVASLADDISKGSYPSARVMTGFGWLIASLHARGGPRPHHRRPHRDDGPPRRGRPGPGMTRARRARMRTLAALAVHAGIPPSEARDLPADLVEEIFDMIERKNSGR